MIVCHSKIGHFVSMLRKVGLLVLCCGGQAIVGMAADEQSSFRIGFASNMFKDVNANDANAAAQVWAEELARSHEVPSIRSTSILADVGAMKEAFRSGELDGMALTTIDYCELRKSVRFDLFFVPYLGGQMDEEYVLLVRKDGGVEDFAALKGKVLTIFDNPRTSLATCWLDTALHARGFGLHEEVFGEVSNTTRLARAVLPVFFGQSDACLVTRSGFETMVELNPQTGKMLKILAGSERLVPSLFCIEADYPQASKNQMLVALRELHLSPNGRQVLTLFKSDEMREKPESCLQSSLELVEMAAKLRKDLEAGL